MTKEQDPCRNDTDAAPQGPPADPPSEPESASGGFPEPKSVTGVPNEPALGGDPNQPGAPAVGPRDNPAPEPDPQPDTTPTEPNPDQPVTPPAATDQPDTPAADPRDNPAPEPAPQPETTPTEPNPDQPVTPPGPKKRSRAIPPLASSFGAPPQLTTIQRLRDYVPTDRLNGWLVTIGITLLAFVTRIVNVGHPSYIVFDETYYAKDGYSLLKNGYEARWPDWANDSVNSGTPDVMLNQPDFVVHPPLGKWLIASGEYLFGMNSFGWRFGAVIFGTLLIFATIRLARRVSRSTLIGGIAGLLLTLDGLAFTMSRIALLDIFQATFLVIAVSCVVADRDYFRAKLAAHLERNNLRDLGGNFGPIIGWRPWRLAAGIAFGLACGVKWNSVYALAAFGILTVLWDVGARRLAGARMKSWLALLIDGVPAFLYMVVVGAAAYLSTWTGWFLTEGGWDRQWAAQNPDHPLAKALPDALASLFWYHKEVYEFHTGDFINSATHPYEAHPIGWLVMARPIGIDAVNDIPPGQKGCPGPDNCLQVISGMGTPILWWLAAAALIVGLIWWLAARDWRFSVPAIGALSTYLPWFQYTERPLFFFYAITIIPFTVIGLALVLGLILGDPEPRPRRRKGAIAVGVIVAVVALNFALIYPLLTDQTLPYTDWLARMWFRGWI